MNKRKLIGENYEHQQGIIELFCNELAKHLRPNELIPHLKRDNIISLEDKENIEAEQDSSGNMAATIVLLDCICKCRVSDWFDKFLQILMECKFPRMVHLVDDTWIASKIFRYIHSRLNFVNITQKSVHTETDLAHIWQLFEVSVFSAQINLKRHYSSNFNKAV